MNIECPRCDKGSIEVSHEWEKVNDYIYEVWAYCVNCNTDILMTVKVLEIVEE